MKAKHRHELKTNELAEWIANFPQWVKKNARTIIFVTAVSVLVIVSYAYYSYTKNISVPKRQSEFTRVVAKLPRSKVSVLQAQLQGNDYSATLLQLANEIQFSLTATDNENAAALALIKYAQTLRTELHYRPQAVSDDEILIQISKAKASYNDALKKAEGNASLTAMAKLGLALCEEELGNFPEAEKIYNEIVNDPSLDVTTAKAQAQVRLKVMTDYQKKVVFKEPPRASIETIEPDIKLDSLDINLPVPITE